MGNRIENNPQIQITTTNGKLVDCKVLNAGTPDDTLSFLHKYLKRQKRIGYSEIATGGFLSVLSFDQWSNVTHLLNTTTPNDFLETSVKTVIGVGCFLGGALLVKDGFRRNEHSRQLNNGLKSAQITFRNI